MNPLSVVFATLATAATKIEMIFSDIDGTLIHPTDITIAGHGPEASTLDMLERIALSNTIDFCYTTGRSPASVYALRDFHMPFVSTDEAYMIGNNGSVVYAPGNELIHQAEVKLEALEIVEKLVYPHKDVDLYAYLLPSNEFVMTHHDFYNKNDAVVRECEFLEVKVLPEGVKISEYAKETGQVVNAIKAKSESHEKPYYKGFWSMDEFNGELDEVEEKLISLGCGFVRALDTTIDIIQAGTNKRTAVQKVLAHRQISKRECIALGDGSNDVEFMSACATSVSMGNGKPETKQGAVFVTDHVSKHGWAKAINRYIDVPYKIGKNGEIVNLVFTDDHGPETEALKPKLSAVNVPLVTLYPFASSEETSVTFGGARATVDGDIVFEDTIDASVVNGLAESAPVFVVPSGSNTVQAIGEINIEEWTSVFGVDSIELAETAEADVAALYIYAADVTTPEGYEAISLDQESSLSDSGLIQIRHKTVETAIDTVAKKLGSSRVNSMVYSYQNGGLYDALALFDNNVFIKTVGSKAKATNAVHLADSAEAGVHRYIGFELMSQLSNPTMLNSAESVPWYLKSYLRGNFTE